MKCRQKMVLYTTLLLIIGNSGCISLRNADDIETPTPSVQIITYPIEKPTEVEIGDILSPPLNEPKGTEPNFSIPTPSDGKSVLFGQMLTPGINGKPYIGDLYLADLLHPKEADQPPMIRFSETLNPRAIVNPEGYFYFVDIEPGEYALIVYSLGGTYIIPDRERNTMIIIVEADIPVDLGIITIP